MKKSKDKDICVFKNPDGEYIDLFLKGKKDTLEVLSDSETSPNRIVADHLVGAASFTAKYTIGGNLQTDRVAVLLTMNRNGINRGLIHEPEMVLSIINETIDMLASMVGPIVMQQAKIIRMNQVMDSMVDDAMSDIGIGDEKNN